MITIRPGPKRISRLQKGPREHLLCSSCEGHLNDHYEKYFRHLWYDRRVLPERFDNEYIRLSGLDYSKFKLFHLSVLWRASVSTLPQFSHVSLGQHEEMIREMLLSGNPDTVWKYQIRSTAVLDRERHVLGELVITPLMGRLEGHRIYAMVYGGCEWHFKVSSHSLGEYTDISLTEEGTLMVGAYVAFSGSYLKCFKDIILDE